jgi:hypothetical protein
MRITIKKVNGGDPKKPTKKQSDMMKSAPKKAVLMSTGLRPKIAKMKPRPMAKMSLGGITGGKDKCWDGGKASGTMKTSSVPNKKKKSTVTTKVPKKTENFNYKVKNVRML